MSKLDKLMGLSSIGESIGNFERKPVAGVGPRALSADQAGRERAKDAWTIEVDRILPDPDQPRKEFDPDALARLAESLRTRGQLQPIQVRWDEPSQAYIVLIGERRWRAAQLAGLDRLHCVVRNAPLSDDERLSLQLVENCLREDLSPMEQARAFRSLMESQAWSQERLAEELAVSRPSVVKAMSLLKLPDAVQEEVEQGGVAPSVAYELAKLDDPTEQVRLAKAVREQGMTRDDVTRQIRSAPKKKPAAKRLPPAMVWRFSGYRVEVSRKAGVETVAAIAVLEEALSRLKASVEGQGAQEAA